MNKDFSFSKKERLHKQIMIDDLFSNGQVFKIPSFRVHFLIVADQNPSSVQLLISVSAKIFKKSVDRNRIKRLIRESYRLNKSNYPVVLPNKNQSLLVGIIFTGKSLPDYKNVEERIVLILNRLIKEVETAI